MIGFGANRRGGRMPSFILVFLMVIIGVLVFNYWTVSNKHGHLLDELAEIQTQVKRSDAARSRLEKRNSELIVQVDTHKKQIDQKDGDYSLLEGKLQAREGAIKKCSDEKVKLQTDVTSQMAEVQRLREQLTELKQEFMKQEEQLREVKKNSSSLERKLEYESLQCGRQIAQLKGEYEEAKKTLEKEVSKLRLTVVGGLGNVGAGKHAGEAGGADVRGERQTVATHQHDRHSEIKEEMGKPGSDAGMPGIEDSEVGKMDEVQFALKKPAITQKQNEAPDVGAAAGAGPGPEAADGPGGQGMLLDQPRLQQERIEGRAGGLAPPVIIKQGDKPIVFEEDSKAGIKADELGEQQRQIPVDRKHLKMIPLPHDNAQVPKPVQQRAKEKSPCGAAAPPPKPLKQYFQGSAVKSSHAGSMAAKRGHLCRFFDENESPVDPQHGSKLADYNGDDGNVGEYEADKQAELAYNEEEDGDGGEEDVQDDDDRDIQDRDRAVDYGKRHQNNDIL